MFEEDKKTFNEVMLEKLLKLSPSKQEQLIGSVRKRREEREKEELQMITDKENKLKEQLQNPNIL